MRLKKLWLIMVLGFAGASPALTTSQKNSSRLQLSPDHSIYAGQESPVTKPPSSALSPADECDVSYQKGDCDRDQRLRLADVTRLLNAVFLDSDGSCPFCLADMNCDRLLTATDVVWFIRYFYLGSPAPRRCP